MEILSLIWNYYLYIPLFNLLVWLYNGYSMNNLGIAVILLTVILRLALLPFTILTEQGKVASEQLFKEVKEAQKDYAHDSVKKKQAIRQILKKKKIRPWANTVVLGVQALVLLLLYQVFIGGINTEAKLHLIYPGIMRPDFVNTKFLWFDIGQINYPAAAIAAGYLFFEMMLARWDQRNKMSKRERVFLIFFPLSLFLALAILPSVKSIFILTTLVFSTIISLITMFIKYNINQSKLKKK